MNIAVVDDLPADRVQLACDIKKYAKENAISIHLTEYESSEEFLGRACLLSLDIVFLDIFMGKINGMDAAYQVKKCNPGCQIIFVTTSKDFAVQSYDVRAFYYIVKPYTYDCIANIMGLLGRNLKKTTRQIAVKEGRKWCKILLSEILYADYNNHYVQIHTEDAIISSHMKFAEIEEMLLVYGEFLGCYRCIIVNMDKIKKVDDLFFLLNNGEYIPINRKHVKEIKTQYLDYVFGNLEE